MSVGGQPAPIVTLGRYAFSDYLKQKYGSFEELYDEIQDAPLGNLVFHARVAEPTATGGYILHNVAVELARDPPESPAEAVWHVRCDDVNTAQGFDVNESELTDNKENTERDDAFWVELQAAESFTTEEWKELWGGPERQDVFVEWE